MIELVIVSRLLEYPDAALWQHQQEMFEAIAASKNLPKEDAHALGIFLRDLTTMDPLASLMRWWCKSPKPGQSKTWVLFGKTNHGKLSGEILYWLVGQGKKLFRWRLPEGNPYLRTETRNTYTSRFTEVAMAFASI